MDAQNYSSPPNDYKNSVVYHLKYIYETLMKKGYFGLSDWLSHWLSDWLSDWL